MRMDESPLLCTQYGTLRTATAGMQTFEDRTFDATNYIESTVGCLSSCGVLGWTRKQLHLGNDEARLTITNNCIRSVQKRPYAQLGMVDVDNVCLCCWAVRTDLNGERGPGLSRGWGCDQAWSAEVSAELQARKVGRGNIAQLKAQEVLAERVDHLHEKLDVILAHLRLDAPPPPGTATVAAPEPAEVARDYRE